MIHAIAILDTMWDWKGITSSAGHTRQAPRFFKINPNNFSGRRLYSLIGRDNSLFVTDACKELVDAAHKHGTPDPKWLFDNLTILHSNGTMMFDVILVCGKVAQATYNQCHFKPSSRTRVIEIPHPAARVVWTREYTKVVKDQIKGVIRL